MRFVVPTGRGYVVIAMAIGSFLVMLVNPGFAITAFCALVWAVVLVSMVGAVFSLRHVELVREPSQDGRRGQYVDLPVRVSNRSRRIRQAIVVAEECPFADAPVSCHVIPSLSPREERRVRRPIRAAFRGQFTMRNITLRGGDPAGLFARQRSYHFQQDLQIFPETEDLGHLPLQDRRRARPSITGQPIGTSGIGQDLFGIREYRATDGVRFIDWKASARQQKLMVREFEESSIHQVGIFLDSNLKFVNKRSEPNNFECQVKIAASLMSYLSGIHCEVVFSCGEETDGMQAVGPAATVYDEVMQMLTCVKPGENGIVAQLDTMLERLSPDAIVYCLTVYEPPEMGRMFEVLMGLGVAIRWIHAPRALFEKEDDTDKIAMAEEYAASSERLVHPMIVNPRTDIPQLLMQMR